MTNDTTLKNDATKQTDEALKANEGQGWNKDEKVKQFFLKHVSLMGRSVRYGLANYFYSPKEKKRCARGELWYLVLVNLFMTIAITDISQFGILEKAYLIFTLPLFISAYARRLQDIGRDGRWVLLILTGIGAIPVIYWCCLKGDEGANAYGEPSKWVSEV